MNVQDRVLVLGMGILQPILVFSSVHLTTIKIQLDIVSLHVLAQNMLIISLGNVLPNVLLDIGDTIFSVWNYALVQLMVIFLTEFAILYQIDLIQTILQITTLKHGYSNVHFHLLHLEIEQADTVYPIAMELV